MVFGFEIVVNRKTVVKIMHQHRLHGLPGVKTRFRAPSRRAATADLVERQ
jgi:hypothetical protein